MNLAMITAAGRGTRMHNSIPKQFVIVDGRPVIIHTLTAFQRHSEIDVICVACLAGWQETLKQYAIKYKITKLRHIITGGETGQESIRLGLTELRRHYSDTDIVLIHDGVRPMVSDIMISDCINTTKRYGNAIAAIPCQEAPLICHDKTSATQYIPRENLRRTQTPHGFYLGDIFKAHMNALRTGITNSVAGCTMMIDLGQRIFFCTGSEKNIKLTTPEDFEIFNALLKANK